MRNRSTVLFVAMLAAAWGVAPTAPAQQLKLKLTPDMVVNESDLGNPEAMVDEQEGIADSPAGAPENTWKVPSNHWREFPYSAHIDLGRETNLATLWIFDTYNTGELEISIGEPGQWKKTHTFQSDRYMTWTKIPLDVTTRYLRFTRVKPSCIFSEIALYEYTPEAHAAMLQRKAAETKAAAQREIALKKAHEEAQNRPLIDLGEPFGRLPLVDEIDCGSAAPDHQFLEDPSGVSRVETILGRACRVLKKTPDEAAHFAYRVGRMKLLKPGGAYLLTVEYPEDAPRSMIILNAGNETAWGFHTGITFGDAFHPKYVKNNNESLRVPLSGKYETWKMLFHLHDRFPDVKFIRGAGLRALVPEDGFSVVVCQFSASNIPASRGAAVARIRLFEVPDPETFQARYNPPPEGLPRRHVFWREEMADGVIASAKQNERGVRQMLDWYRYKAATMRFLGINTYTKDLLEFGACQGWDSSAGGGNDWVYYNYDHKDLWSQIVELMGRQGFDVLPYYEYSGSKGGNGLGNQRRARPLTRDDAYTHIQWIETSNADITDPDTYADFKKMLDLTIVRHKDKAHFLGAWLRPRSQIPIGFGDATRARFATEAHQGRAVSRRQLIDDKALLDRYYDWWYGKRREFLAAMRDHLRTSGVDPKAVVLYTASASEPGVSFPTWDKQFVTDDVEAWNRMLQRPEVSQGQEIRPLHIDEVIRNDMYLQALLHAPLNWGGWEVHHASPPADPDRYRETDGILMTHGFGRAYTVGSPKTFDRFRGPAGLAVVRHYALNENMTYDKNDHEKLGYFVADIERAGPYCMLAEARAMAYGDPNYIGYLVGLNFNRGFPEYVRAFNTAFLSLPALPSEVIADAASDPEVVVRSIATPQHGTYLAVVNVGLTGKEDVTVELPAGQRVTDAVTGEALSVRDGRTTLSMYACQLRALRVE
ncbi:MAG: hypothetical protein JXB62_03695 [Pirellulales bacterium]|nr:hypothetical protein [Pirellulales bacterium]